MKNRVAVVTLLICVATALALTTVEAQNKRVGTASGSELLIPVGARDLAMGGSSIATSSGIEAVHWNPAGLGRMKSSAEGMFSSMKYIADIGVSFGGVGASFGGFGVIGFTVKSLDFGSIPLTTEDDPEGKQGRFYSPTFVTLGLTYARSLTDAVSVGGTVKVISEQIERVSASGFAIDVGVQYSRLIGINGLSLGVAIKNIGPQMKYDGPGLLRTGTSSEGFRPEQRYQSIAASFELPSTVEIGLGYNAVAGDAVKYSLNGSFSNNNLYLDEYKFGGEIGYSLESVTLFGRAGLGVVPSAKEKENIFGPTVGAGISYAAPGIDLTFDYAYRKVDFFDANQVISIRLGF